MNQLNNYILITPIKNEAKLLDGLINTVKNQSIRPIIWIIVNDGSTDSTENILKNAELENYWIKQLKLNESKRDVYTRPSFVCKKGFDYALEISVRENFNYNYIARLDSDMLLPKDYFGKLIHEFDKNKNLGIACGTRTDIINNNKIKAKTRNDEPYAAACVFSRKCFEEIGGFILTQGDDVIMNAKAKMNNWACKVFESLNALHLRPVNIHYRKNYGVWKEYKRMGEKDYYLNYNLFVVLIKSFKHSLVKMPPRPLYAGLAYFLGFLLSPIRGKNKIDDLEVREYYRHVYLKNMMERYLNKF